MELIKCHVLAGPLQAIIYSLLCVTDSPLYRSLCEEKEEEETQVSTIFVIDNHGTTTHLLEGILKFF